MLDAIPQLPEHDVGNIKRVLAHEINADAFRTNQPHHLLDLLFYGRLDVGEDQVRFVEKENQLWFFRVADLRQTFEELGEQPEEKRGVNLGRLLHQLFRGQNVDHPSSRLRLDQIVEIERRLSEKFIGTLRFQFEQVALDGAGARGGNIAVLRFELIGVIGHVLHHRTQIFQIEQE